MTLWSNGPQHHKIATYVKTERKKAGLSQEELALRSGLGLQFVIC